MLTTVPEDISGFSLGCGDPISLAEARTTTFPRRKVFLVSTPTIESLSRINKEWLEVLAEEQYLRGWDYPLHLGVTEAGEGEDGRMKSAIGIGALLADGLGDTIRVSLTEDPEFEIEPCSRLAALGAAADKQGWGVAPFEEHRDTHAFERR